MTMFKSIEERKTYYRQYYWKNREKKLVEMKNYREKRNKDQVRAYARSYYKKNRNKILEIQKRSNLKYAEKRRLTKIKYYQKHKETIRKKIYKAQDIKRFGCSRHKILEHFKFACQKCHKLFPSRKLVVHHLDGNGRGKKTPNNTFDNLTILCRGCHTKKHLYKYHQWLKEQFKVGNVPI